MNAATDARPGIDWPQFRGIRANGIGEGFPLPTSWDIAKKDRVAWKTPIAGLGLSSPIVWGDLVCLSTAISGEKSARPKVGPTAPKLTVNGWRHMGAYDFKTGQEIWKLNGGGDTPAADARRPRRLRLHHERARPEGAGLRHRASTS